MSSVEVACRKLETVHYKAKVIKPRADRLVPNIFSLCKTDNVHANRTESADVSYYNFRCCINSVGPNRIGWRGNVKLSFNFHSHLHHPSNCSWSDLGDPYVLFPSVVDGVSFYGITGLRTNMRCLAWCSPLSFYPSRSCLYVSLISTRSTIPRYPCCPPDREPEIAIHELLCRSCPDTEDMETLRNFGSCSVRTETEVCFSKRDIIQHIFKDFDVTDRVSLISRKEMRMPQMPPFLQLLMAKWILLIRNHISLSGKSSVWITEFCCASAFFWFPLILYVRPFAKAWNHDSR